MNEIRNRIAVLRQIMEKNSIDAYYVPTEDYHLSEYVSDHFESRAFLSGFTGSAGTLVVLKDKAGLWTDGRYFIQAEEQLADTGIDLFKSGVEGTPEILDFLTENLSKGCCVGLDGRLVSAAYGLELEEQLAKKGVSIHADMDLISEMWSRRPALPDSRIWIYEEAYAGASVEEKLTAVRDVMKSQNADYHLMSMLDEIAWLLNIRGDDVAYNPVILSFVVLTQTEVLFFVDEKKLDVQTESYFKEHHITLKPYDGVYAYLENLDKEKSILLSPEKINLALFKKLMHSGVSVIEQANPVLALKAIKNPVEIASTRKAHRKDGVIMVRFMRWLKTNVKKQQITEASAAAYLDQLRKDAKHNLGLSFSTISGYAAHGAIVHYSVTGESDIPLEEKGLLLVDSGGHYLEGTTDITRTFALGPLTEEEYFHFSIVLRSMLNLSAAVFSEGTTCQQLDMIAHEPMWANELDFMHGTGHGVGHLLNVHEGPNSISWKNRKHTKPVEMKPGMITTDEPGLYFEGKHGIRIENELLCKKRCTNAYGNFLDFEVLTLAPIDLDAVNPALLSTIDKQRLNDYHRRVYTLLSPELDPEERQWLAHYTREI